MSDSRVYLNIPAAHFHPVLSWDQSTIDRLVGQAIRAAVQVGLQIPDDHDGIILTEANGKGATIDKANRAVRFSESDVRATIEVMRKTCSTPDPVRARIVGHDGQEGFGVGNGANLLFDAETWQVRPPSAEDLVELCRWAQGCGAVASVFPPVILKDIDQRLAPIYSYALMGKYCGKQFFHEQPTEPIHVKYLDRMARVVESHRGYFQPMQAWEYINPPFKLGRRAVETLLTRIDLGVCDHVGIGMMTVAGMTAPVTVAGAVVAGVGEVLAGLTLMRILRPAIGLRTGMFSGRLDLRTARVSYYSLRTWLQNLAGWEVLVRGLGVDGPCLTWYRDANEPGMQALYEFGTAQAFFSAVLDYCTPEIGGLGCGNIYSPEQAVLDMEAMREFRDLTTGFDASEEVAGLNAIIEGGFDASWHMSSEHTLDHMKEGVPYGRRFFRGLAAGAQHDRNRTQTEELLQMAKDEVRKAKAAGKEFTPDTKLSGELYEHVRVAAKELSIEAPPLV